MARGGEWEEWVKGEGGKERGFIRGLVFQRLAHREEKKFTRCFIFQNEYEAFTNDRSFSIPPLNLDLVTTQEDPLGIAYLAQNQLVKQLSMSQSTSSSPRTVP